MVRRLALGVLLAILLLVPALAVEVDHTNIKTSVEPGEVARFTLMVKNDQSFDDTFYLSLDDIRFSPTTDPITFFTSGIKVKQGQEVKTELLVVPHPSLRIGEYNVRADLTSKQTGKVYSTVLTLYVAPSADRYLAPNVSVYMDAPSSIDPREPFTIHVAAANNNKLDLGETKVDVKSGLFQDSQVQIHT